HPSRCRWWEACDVAGCRRWEGRDAARCRRWSPGPDPGRRRNEALREAAPRIQQARPEQGLLEPGTQLELPSARGERPVPETGENSRRAEGDQREHRRVANPKYRQGAETPEPSGVSSSFPGLRGSMKQRVLRLWAMTAAILFLLPVPSNAELDAIETRDLRLVYGGTLTFLSVYASRCFENSMRFHGKVRETNEHPESILYQHLCVPRRAAPRWYHEGIAVFMETWMAGGLGRAQGPYDEMVFRSMVRDSTRFYDPLGLEAEGTKVD